MWPAGLPERKQEATFLLCEEAGFPRGSGHVQLSILEFYQCGSCSHCEEHGVRQSEEEHPPSSVDQWANLCTP